MNVPIRNLLLYRHVVPPPNYLWVLPAPDTSLDCHCTSLSSYQTGPEVWLASCHLSNVHQQVSQHLPQGSDPILLQKSGLTQIILSSLQYRGTNSWYDCEQSRLWRYSCVHTSDQWWVQLLLKTPISNWLTCMHRLTVALLTLHEPPVSIKSFFSFISVGTGGNLVAIQASRMSTFFHYRSAPEDHPLKLTGSCLDVFCSSG